MQILVKTEDRRSLQWEKKHWILKVVSGKIPYICVYSHKLFLYSMFINSSVHFLIFIIYSTFALYTDENIQPIFNKPFSESFLWQMHFSVQ